MRRILRPFVDRREPGKLCYQGGQLLRVQEPPRAKHIILTLKMLRRHNSLDPELEPTNRIFLRWGEKGGTGMPNPEADVRETHYDPLPLADQECVDEIVRQSPWEALMRKWYRTNLDTKALAESMGISRQQIYTKHSNALWYFRGRLEAARFDVSGFSAHPG